MFAIEKLPPEVGRIIVEQVTIENHGEEKIRTDNEIAMVDCEELKDREDLAVQNLY